MTADGLQTEQLYEPLSGNKSRLTFSLFFHDQEPTYFETLKMYGASYRIRNIFKANLKNVKRILEENKKG